jgi:hypothetical protein
VGVESRAKKGSNGRVTTLVRRASIYTAKASSSVFAPVEPLFTAAVDVSFLCVFLAGVSVSFVAILSPGGSQLVDNVACAEH